MVRDGVGRIYSPRRGKYSEVCQPVEPCDFQQIGWLLDGTPRTATWEPLPVRLVTRGFDQGRLRDFLPSDAPWFEGVSLILKRRAVDSLRPLLEEYGEILPLRCDEIELFAYNPTRVLDAIDETRSTIMLSTTGRPMIVEIPVFKPDVIRGIDIFKVSTTPGSLDYMSQRFVDQWNTAGLQGLEFKLEWTPD